VEAGVRLTVVVDEIEAELVCGLLRAAGLECGHQVTETLDSAMEGFASTGPREILVHERELETARRVLAESREL
jgi:hypothetical protein